VWRDYDAAVHEQEQADEDIARMDVGQRAVYDEILHLVLNCQGKRFFLSLAHVELGNHSHGLLSSTLAEGTGSSCFL
jgi:hypothetical protein